MASAKCQRHIHSISCVILTAHALGLGFLMSSLKETTSSLAPFMDVGATSFISVSKLWGPNGRSMQPGPLMPELGCRRTGPSVTERDDCQ